MSKAKNPPKITRPTGGVSVVPPPLGSSTKTRLRLTLKEQATLEHIAAFLAQLRNQDLKNRVKIGDVNSKQDQSLPRKIGLTKLSSSRYANTIVRANNDEYKLALRNQESNLENIQARIKTIESKLKLPLKTTVGKGQKYGYRSSAEAGVKRLRLSALKDKEQKLLNQVKEGKLPVVKGSRKLFKYRQFLENQLSAGKIEAKEYESRVGEWKREWETQRFFLKALGETGKKYGNETIRLELNPGDKDGVLQVKIPKGLQERYGTHLRLKHRVSFAHLKDELYDKVVHREHVAYEVTFEPKGDCTKVFLTAS